MSLLALHLNISEISDKEFIQAKQETYSYARKHIYNVLSTITKTELEVYIQQKFEFNSVEARSLISDVQTLVDQTQTNKNKTEIRILKVQEKLKELNSKPEKTKKERRSTFQLTQKLGRLEKSLVKDITFGTKVLLKKISRLHNQKDTLKLEHALQEYRSARINPLYLLGEANQKGNRFFDFDLNNNTIYYKPYKGKRIEIKFKDKRKDLCKILQELSEQEILALTLHLSVAAISIHYDDTVISGYKINEKERKKEVQQIKKDHISKEIQSELIKKVYVKYHKDLENRQLEGKKANRYFAFDTNPNFIGCAILDKIGTDIKIVKCFYYDLTLLNAIKETSKHLTNKRHHMIHQLWRDIFRTISYYKCAYIIQEKLDFTLAEIKQNKEFNRQTKNLWYRTLSTQILNKNCNRLGLQTIEINAIYTSTIGNLCYNYTDCINASIEIGRRGIFKFIKGAFYPALTLANFPAMSRLNPSRDVETLKECKTWIDMHATIKSTGLRNRKSLVDLKTIGYLHKYTKSSKLLHSHIRKVIF